MKHLAIILAEIYARKRGFFALPHDESFNGEIDFYLKLGYLSQEEATLLKRAKKKIDEKVSKIDKRPLVTIAEEAIREVISS